MLENQNTSKNLFGISWKSIFLFLLFGWVKTISKALQTNLLKQWQNLDLAKTMYFYNLIVCVCVCVFMCVCVCVFTSTYREGFICLR